MLGPQDQHRHVRSRPGIETHGLCMSSVARRDSGSFARSASGFGLAGGLREQRLVQSGRGREDRAQILDQGQFDGQTRVPHGKRHAGPSPWAALKPSGRAWGGIPHQVLHGDETAHGMPQNRVGRQVPQDPAGRDVVGNAQVVQLIRPDTSPWPMNDRAKACMVGEPRQEVLVPAPRAGEGAVQEQQQAPRRRPPTPMNDFNAVLPSQTPPRPTA